MGRVITETVEIPSLGREKRLHVYLPDGAGTGNRSYPVLYMQDGHNLFDAKDSAFGSSWEVGQTLDAWERKTGENCIVVGIDCPSLLRFDEYSPWKNEHPESLPAVFRCGRVLGGEGEAYAAWFLGDLKKRIDSRYPTDRETTWLAGSSMGAVISLYAGFRHAENVRKIGAFSPAAWFAEASLLEFLARSARPEVGVWVDVGTAETSDPNDPSFPEQYLSGARKIRQALENRGTRELVYREIPGGIHHESAWAERFPGFVRWLFQA